MSVPEPFTFSDYLNRLPASLVFDKLVKQSSAPRKIISASMIKEITARFSSEKNLLDIFSGLSEEAKFTCSLVYLHCSTGLSFDGRRGAVEAGGKGPGRKSGMARDVSQPWKDTFNGFDDELLGSFLVYAGDSHGKMFYAGFEEFEPALRNICCRTITNRAHVRPEKEAFSHPHLCLNDVSVVVGLASQGKLTTTKAGGLSKMSTLCMDKLLHGSHSLFETGQRDLNPSLFPVRFALKRGLLAPREDRLAASHGRMVAWLSEPAEARCVEIVDFAYSAFPLWKKNMVEELLPKAGKPWLSANSFGERRKEETCANVKMLAYCGVADFYHSGGDCVFTRSRRHCPAPDAWLGKRPQRPIIIQPDFSALLPQETLPEHLYWFSRVGSLASLDKVYHGTITKDSINTTLSEGVAGEGLLDRLIAWQSPANVVETVREWIREFSRVSLLTGSFVVSAEEKVTRQLRSYAPLSGCLEPVKADCVFRVTTGKEGAVADLLVAMGFDPRPSLTQAPEKATGDGRGSPFMHETLAIRLTPVVDFEKKPPSPFIVKQGKYGPQLKALETADLMHVIDYALLMGNRLRVEYAGGPKLRKGDYIIRPLHYKKGEQPLLEAETGKTNAKKSFVIDNIRRIGVEPDDENQ